MQTRCLYFCFNELKIINFYGQRIMEGISVSGEVGGAGGAYSYNALKRLDQLWYSICSDQAGISLFIASITSNIC